jgi:hypothetical protein
MIISEIVQKFVEKPNRMTTGAGSLSKSYECSIQDIWEARKLAKKQLYEISESIEIEDSGSINKGKLKSRWQNSGGKWLESYKFDEEEKLENVDYGKIFIEAISKSEVKPYYPTMGIIQAPTSGKTLNLYLSDQHIGADVSNALYSNKFDREIFSGRMHKVFYNVSKMLVAGDVLNKINVIFLGDTFDTRGGHNLPQNMSNKECFETFLEVHMDFFDKLVHYNTAKEYAVIFQPNSNHGGDMDYMGFKALECWMNQKYPFIKTTILDTFIGVIKEGIHTFMLTHGKDQKDMKFGLPLQLNDKAELFINQFIDINNLKGELSFVKGDLHQSSTFFSKKFRYKNVGSIFGSSSWIMTNFGYTKPMCCFDIFNKDNPNITEGVIYL